MKLWIDECLSPALVGEAQHHGFEATSNRDRGMLGAADPDLLERVVAELAELRDRTLYPRDKDLVFCHPETGHPLDRSKLVRRFRQAVERAQVRTITFHELRHTFGTRMAAAGVPLRTLQQWMGHADAKTTQVYAHYQPSADEAGVVDRAFA